MRNRSLAVLSFLLVFSFLLEAASAPKMSVVRHLPLGGDGGWDYLIMDNAARRIYVARATRVMVVDADSGKLIAEIPDTQGVHGIALAAGLKRGFITAGRANNIVVFDLETLKPLATITAGENPDAILYEPTTQRVFAFNGRSKNATVVDAKTNQVQATIPLSGKPEFAQHDGHGRVFVNIEDKSTVAVIDASALKVTAEWPLTGCQYPTGLAIDRGKGRLFAGCVGNNVMSIVGIKEGRVLASVPIGAGCDGTEFDASYGLVYAANGRDGNVTVVSETAAGKFEAVQTVTTQVSGRTIALDDKTHRLFIPAAKLGAAPPGQRPEITPGSFELLVIGPGEEAEGGRK